MNFDHVLKSGLLGQIPHDGIRKRVLLGMTPLHEGLFHGSEARMQYVSSALQKIKDALGKTAQVKGKSEILKNLLEAKKRSDISDFTTKNSILSDLLRKQPNEFYVDSELNPKYVGVTHKPTGFRIHTSRAILPHGIEHRLPAPKDGEASGNGATRGGKGNVGGNQG